MKTVLGIDTSTLTASVAIVRGAGPSASVLASGASGVSTHSERLLCLIDDALRASALSLAELDGIAVGAGPGSFTGLRIGMATAKGLAFAAQKPLWAVSSLAALALSAGEREEPGARTLVVPVLDARRGEIFAGFYRVDGGKAEAVAAERVLAPGALRDVLEPILADTGCTRVVAAGDGFAVYADVLARALADRGQVAARAPETPEASAVARLALAGEHPDILTSGAPVYIRLSEAELASAGRSGAS